MKKFLCLVLALLMIVPCAFAAKLENVYQSEEFSIYPLPGYTMSTHNDSIVYVKDDAIINASVIPLEKYTFEEIVDLYDTLLAGFLSGAASENADISIVDVIDFYYYTVKIAKVKDAGKTMYYSIIPGPGAVLAFSFQDKSSYRPEKDFANFLYGAVPNV